MKRRLSSVCAAVVFGLAPAVADAAACYNPAEAAAVNVRMLQSELMVAALACRDSNPELGMVAQYNGFIQRFGDRLVVHSRALQARFRSEYGADFQRRMDTFITALANDASKRSMTGARYCESAAAVFTEVTELPRDGLEKLSAQRAALLGSPVAACSASAATSEKR